MKKLILALFVVTIIILMLNFMTINQIAVSAFTVYFWIVEKLLIVLFEIFNFVLG
ncbi:MAG: hypothetical protein UMR38_01905 [Candidatus Izemoplasma sp.]|nr:hypothetical protein [Candidatus Izemoplasma sp.]